MSIETTVFDFRISKSFEEWAAVFDSDKNKEMLNSLGIVPLYRGLNQDDSSRAIVIFQAKKGIALQMWLNKDSKKMIESSGHIYSETEITHWGWGTSYPS
tara:strand:+ start:699 stop:998 length:300 start_codon:yes stop_codon:yes gene_type:complete